jgi:proton-dependent oligopeptide transporter, POT family
MPIFGAVVADQFTGRFNAICIFTVVVGIGHIILTGQSYIVEYMLYSILTSITGVSVPSLLQKDPNGAFAGFMVSIIIIGIGTGGSKFWPL